MDNVLRNISCCAHEKGCVTRKNILCRACPPGPLAFFRSGPGKDKVVICTNRIASVNDADLTTGLREEFYHALSICQDGRGRHSALKEIYKELEALDWAAPVFPRNPANTLGCAKCVADEMLAKRCAGITGNEETLLQEAYESCGPRGTQECSALAFSDGSVQVGEAFPGIPNFDPEDPPDEVHSALLWWSQGSVQNACNAINSQCGL